jgi:hypothetical protein
MVVGSSAFITNDYGRVPVFEAGGDQFGRAEAVLFLTPTGTGTTAAHSFPLIENSFSYAAGGPASIPQYRDQISWQPLERNMQKMRCTAK